MPPSDDTAILVVAAGRGHRAGGGTPKQYRRLGGKLILARTLARLREALPGADIICAIHPDDRPLYDEAVACLPGPATSGLLAPVAGGETRQASVRAGLHAIKKIKNAKKIVLIHDSVRCFFSNELVQELLRKARNTGAAVPALPVTDALKRTAPDGTIAGSVERNGLVAVQTPQAFYLDAISQAHSRAAAAGLNDFPDDAAVAEWAGLTVFTIPGEDANIKLTNPSDFATAESMLLNALPDIRTGSGFDVHAFAEGEGVWLGGVRIAHTHRLAGHSDADVALHALTDAVLGAIAAGDIGQHFPPTDPQWKNAASDRFLRHAIDLVEARGGLVSHLDVTIICEAPRIGPHRDAIRTSIASIARLDPGRVSVKATTTEKLGFTGRREGIAAQAVATVRLPLEEIS